MPISATSPENPVPTIISPNFGQNDAQNDYYYGYRFYNPGTGKWVSRDPVGERGGRNLLNIARNDVINRIDILGLTWEEIASTPQNVWKKIWTTANIRAVNIGVGSTSGGAQGRSNQIFIDEGLYTIANLDFDLDQNLHAIWSPNNSIPNDRAAYYTAITHEIVAIVAGHFEGMGEWMGPQSSMMHPPGSGSGLHHLALLMEWGEWAARRPNWFSCSKVEKRKKEADVSYGHQDSRSTDWVKKVTEAKDFVCNCTCGALANNSEFTYSYEKEKSFIFDAKKLTMEMKLKCNNNRISGGSFEMGLEMDI
jgi:RHS repeat-associated protein